MKIKPLVNSLSATPLSLNEDSINKPRSPFEIEFFPTEAVFAIFEFLKRKDFLTLSLVNRHFYQMTNDQILWKKLFQKEFSCQNKLYEKFGTSITDFKQMYIRLYKTKLNYQLDLYNRFARLKQTIAREYCEEIRELALNKLNEACFNGVLFCLTAQNLRPALLTACLMSEMGKTYAFAEIAAYLLHARDENTVTQFLSNPASFLAKEDLTYPIQESLRTVKIKQIVRKVVEKLLLLHQPEKAEELVLSRLSGEQRSHCWRAIGNYYIQTKKIDRAEALLCGPALKLVCYIGGYHDEFVSNLWAFYLSNGSYKKALVLERYARVGDWTKREVFEKAAQKKYEEGDIASSKFFCTRLLQLDTSSLTKDIPIVDLMCLAIRDNQQGSLYEFATLAPNPKEAVEWMMRAFTKSTERTTINFEDIMEFLKTIVHPDFKMEAQKKISNIRSTFCMDDP